MFDKKLFDILEFDVILSKLADFAVSERTKQEIGCIIPSTDIKDVQNMQQLTKEAYIVRYKYLISPIVQFDDVELILQKAKAGAMLQMGELLKVARLMRSSRIAKKEIEGTGDDVILLKKISAPIFVDKNLEDSINTSIASENEMNDDASDALKTIRRKILSANHKLKEKLNSYTRSSETSKYLQDNLVTIRMGRFVLPVKSECRSSVPGLIHDQSASGSTVFIEPFPIVEMNNELKFLQMEEQREIERILLMLSECVANAYNAIFTCQKSNIMLDIVFAKCAYSVSYNGAEPVLNNNGNINLHNARHPLISTEKVVPIDVSVGKGYKMLIVTGPNTGGKTVCLKTIGLCCLMAGCGLWLPCDENSEISVFDNIYCDLGDEQSIEQSLSTFSAHIVNIVKITNSITPQSLVLMDELGAGTDPIEGAALSIGIIKYMELIGAIGIITTHFSELKEYALISKNLMNACMQFDEATLKPTYKLVVGIPGVSNALKIAGTLGLNDYILQQARANIKEDKIQFEEVLKNAENAKFAALKEAEELQALKQQVLIERETLEREHNALSDKIERLNNNAKTETRRIVNNMVEQANDIIEEIKEKIKDADDAALMDARRLARQLENLEILSDDDMPEMSYVDIDAGSLKLGQHVAVKSLRTDGILNSLPDRKKTVRVLIGNITMNIKTEDLAEPRVAQKKKMPASIEKVAARIKENAPTTDEIKLLGLTVAEAIEQLDPIIRSSFGNNKTLRIVHGKGTGALGKGIQNYLRTNNLVKNYRYGGYGEGDNGVTLAEIK